MTGCAVLLGTKLPWRPGGVKDAHVAENPRPLRRLGRPRRGHPGPGNATVHGPGAAAASADARRLRDGKNAQITAVAVAEHGPEVQLEPDARRNRGGSVQPARLVAFTLYRTGSGLPYFRVLLVCQGGSLMPSTDAKQAGHTDVMPAGMSHRHLVAVGILGGRGARVVRAGTLPHGQSV